MTDLSCSTLCGGLQARSSVYLLRLSLRLPFQSNQSTNSFSQYIFSPLLTWSVLFPSRFRSKYKLRKRKQWAHFWWWRGEIINHWMPLLPNTILPSTNGSKTWQRKMAQVFELLPCSWETQMGFLVPGFRQAQTWSLQSLGELANVRYLSPSPSLPSLSLFISPF